MTNWCTYDYSNRDIPQHIGKIHNIKDNICDIQYSENQMYSRSAWDMDYVKSFDTLEDAIRYMYTHSYFDFLSEIKQDLEYSFAKDSKNVNWDVVLRPLKIQKVTKR